MIIRCDAKLVSIGSWTVLVLPKEASAKLPTRGMTVVWATINGFRFQISLEPDGRGSHWFRVDKSLQETVKADAGDTVRLEMEPVREWPEPQVPEDLKAALAADSRVQNLWNKVTPMARWDWIRWIEATKQPETRRRRIEVAFSKLLAGEKRPCCFNRTACTIPDVSKNGVLLAPVQKTAVNQN